MATNLVRQQDIFGDSRKAWGLDLPTDLSLQSHMPAKLSLKAYAGSITMEHLPRLTVVSAEDLKMLMPPGRSQSADSLPAYESMDEESWRVNLAIGSAVWVHAESTNEWIKGSVIWVSLEYIKVLFRQSGIPRTKMLPRSSQEIRRFSEILAEQIIGSWSSETGRDDRVTFQETAASQYINPEDSDSDSSSMDSVSEQRTGAQDSMPGRTTSRGSFPSDNVTQDSMPELQPVPSSGTLPSCRGTLETLPEMNSFLARSKETPGPNLGAISSSGSRGGFAVGVPMQIRSASAGRLVDGVVIDSSSDKIKVLYYLGNRCCTKIIPSHQIEEPVEELMQLPNLEVGMAVHCATSRGNLVEGVVTDVKGANAKVQYFVDGRCCLKTLPATSVAVRKQAL
mmetsp:Transcript_114701/g.319437  ORF Transcript_114701/g.319437 Transcript_114701/m.319437 type:complete len:395 (-) Transcript_114701:106-1290(-)